MVVLVDPAAGTARVVVDDAPIAAPVEGARLPHASAPLARDSDGFLVGCVGDGTIRRLEPAGSTV